MKAAAGPFDTSTVATQWALLLGHLLILVNFIVALVVPWVEAEMEIPNAWVPIYIPVELGLVRCFSDICGMKKEKGSQHGGKNQGWPPGAGGGGPQINPGGGAKILFQVASVFAVILLSVSLLLALGGSALEYMRTTTRPDIGLMLPLRVTVLASLACLAAVLQYLFITLAGLNGGHYEVGFWLCLSTAVIAGVLGIGQLLINKQWETETGYSHVYLPSHIRTSAAYQQKQQQQQQRPPPSTATLVAPVSRGGYGSVE